MRSTAPRSEDLTARARIREAAIVRFAENGFDGTSLRTVAGDAGVSQGLVIHHFGSKAGLRTACDEHVVEMVRERKTEAMAQGPAMDPLAAMEEDPGSPIVRYLARALVDGSPQVVALVDGMVEAAVDSVEAGIRSGTLQHTDDPRGVATLLTIWSLGALVLHEHVERLLGADLTGAPTERGPYVRAAVEVLAGVITEEVRDNVRRAFGGADHEEDRDG
jgi:TetR/AcrR family transcriptional regulator, regulator of cefoperazone and chloramphenicol sensitivity